MTTGSFEKTNIAWQLQQFSQQAGEWVEWQFSKLSVSPSRSPEFTLPEWILTLLGSFSKVIFWGITGLCLAWLGWQFLQRAFPVLKSWRAQLGQRWAKRRVTVGSRETELNAAGWLQRSQAYQRQGNYREACRALYFALLQRLNEANVVPQQTSRTDGEYLQLINNLPQPQLYALLIATHEQLCFDNAPISPEVFDRCQQAYREIERQFAAGSQPS